MTERISFEDLEEFFEGMTPEIERKISITALEELQKQNMDLAEENVRLQCELERTREHITWIFEQTQGELESEQDVIAKLQVRAETLESDNEIMQSAMESMGEQIDALHKKVAAFKTVLSEVLR